MFRKLALVAASVSALGAGSALAQDYTQPATYGEIVLNAGFVPDPRTVSVYAGGSINAANAIGQGCYGYIANAPDYQITYTPGSYSLYIGVQADTDTTLIINGPDGQWYCDDDGGEGLNPLYTFTSPQAGTYDIWVGTYSNTNTQPATLRISELGGGGQPPVTSVPPQYPTYPNPNLSPGYGTATVQAGIPISPVQVVAGGTIDASIVDGSCRGYIAEAPDYQVNFQTLAGILPLIISVTSTIDTTLVIMDPQGNWHCNDDTNGLDPQVQFNGPQAGRYLIWIGAYSSTEASAATLTVSTGGPLGGGK